MQPVLWKSVRERFAYSNLWNEDCVGNVSRQATSTQ